MKQKRWWIIAGIAAVVLLLAVFSGEILDLAHDYSLKFTDIPKLYLTGNISEMMDKKDVRQVSFKYKDGQQTIDGFAEIKIQGSSSIYYDKKNYTMKFFEDEACSNSLKIDVGWGPQSKYCMKANWIDRTHARNVVTAKLATKVQQKYNLFMDAPRNGLIDGFPIEILANDSFVGLYTFNIPKDAWQFAMDEENPDHIVVCGGEWVPAVLFEDMPDFEAWEVEVGEESEETLEKMNRLFDFVINSSDEEFRENFGQYLNLDSVLNYYVIADIAYLRDNLGRNMLLVTYDGMEWYLSLYDLDSSWGTYPDGEKLYGYEKHNLNLKYNNLFARVEKAFSRELAERYFEIRADLLSNESIMAEFEAFESMIPDGTFEKEYRRWSPRDNISRESLPGADYDQIRSYLEIVSERLDEKYAAWLR